MFQPEQISRSDLNTKTANEFDSNYELSKQQKQAL